MKKRVIALLLISAIIISVSGCSGSNHDMNSSQATSSETDIEVVSTKPTEEPETETSTKVSTETESLLTDEQRNSINMMNYLLVLTQNIYASKNNRIVLDDAYSQIENSVNKKAIDEETRYELEDILNTLHSFQMIDIKRERLQFLYEQNQAAALRSALPNPIGLLSSSNSKNLISLIGSVAYMAIDAKSSYDSAKAEAELQYLQDGWDLDDKEADELNSSKVGMFSYMVTTVNGYDIPEGNYILAPEDIDDFVNATNRTNLAGKIQFLEGTRSIYQNLGPYWSELASCYYEHGDYRKCLDAVSGYERTGYSGIFHRDYEYARILPLAIASAASLYHGDEYIEKVSHYTDLLIANTKSTDSDDWALRYLAAQAYIDLSAKSGDQSYLKKAYDIALNNVNNLVDQQVELNNQYMAPIVEKRAKKDDSKQVKEDIDNYNKMLFEKRKTELPPISEPLSLNCSLLFSLANQLEISVDDQNKINAILRGDTDRLFYVKPVDDFFLFGSTSPATIDARINDGKLILPAEYVSNDAEISGTITSDGKTTELSDWKLSAVDRGDQNKINLGIFQLGPKRNPEGTIDKFYAIYSSDIVKSYKPNASTIIELKIKPADIEGISDFELMFTTHKGKTPGYISVYSYELSETDADGEAEPSETESE